MRDLMGEVQVGLITDGIFKFCSLRSGCFAPRLAFLHRRFISRGEQPMDDNILTWFPNGAPLGPVTSPIKKRKKNWGFGPQAKALKDRLNNAKKRRERWLNRIHKYQVPDNYVNDKRHYYRNEYLLSDHWKALRSEKLKRNPFCERCGRKGRDVHHLRYRNLFDVLLSDLETLCRKCHKKEHEPRVLTD